MTTGSGDERVNLDNVGPGIDSAIARLPVWSTATDADMSQRGYCRARTFLARTGNRSLSDAAKLARQAQQHRLDGDYRIFPFQHEGTIRTYFPESVLRQLVAGWEQE